MKSKFTAGLAPITLCLAALGTAAAQPAQASITFVESASVAGTFQPTYGNDGYVLFDTTAAGVNGGVAGTNVVNAPSYATVDIIGPSQYSGYKYNDITTTLEAGLEGANKTTASTPFSFTISSGVTLPAIIQFGVLANYTGGADDPASITLSDGTGNTATATAGQSPTNGEAYIFDITAPVAGTTYTVSVPNGEISGVTFDSTPAVSAAPEPSQIGMLALMSFSLGGLLLAARRRSVLRC